jgi:NADPH:quinone reductase-like Zn-dependent oxidoreductase
VHSPRGAEAGIFGWNDEGVRALVITEHGPPDVMRVQERPDPEPGPGQVRVRVRAAGVNFADLLARVGLYPEAPKPPCVVGYEIAGDVDAVGEAVEGIEVGQRVMGGSRFGGYAQLAVTSQDALIPMPDGWSYQEGAALPVAYATAYAGLLRYGGLRAGERVLIQAAAGGVGTAATQLAKLAGAEVYGTASPSKHDAIRALGVDHPVDYRTHDVVDEVRRIAGEEHPIDLAFDAIGGRSFKQSFALLRPGGRLVCFGSSEIQAGERRSPVRALRVLAQMPRFSPIKLMRESKSVIGLNMLALWDAKRSLDEYIEPLVAWLDEGRIRPVVAKEFRLDEGPDAHRFVHERKNVGKVVLTI